MSFFSHLESRVHQVDSLLCVGLDPHVTELSEPTPAAARDFCLRLVEATVEVAAAFKPNSAFFETFGAAGMAVLAEVIDAIPDGIPVILDAKRGDIASTAQAYARAVFQTLGADAVTLSPYLGYDSLEPFLEDPERGVFLLCKTSNPGAADLQDLTVIPGSDLLGISHTAADWRVFEVVALLAGRWNTNDNLGVVVGATQPEALRCVRELEPDLWILAPGVGAQGGDLERALEAGLRTDGLGMLLPVSRLLSQSANPRGSAYSLRDQINHLRDTIRDQKSAIINQKSPIPHPSLADDLLDAGCVRFGQFSLKSGMLSPIYMDLRVLVGYPRLLDQVASAYLPILQGLQFDRLAALPYAALPIATAISLRGGWSLVYPRKETKAYGTRQDIEGPYTPGEKVVVIDDLATTGGSKFEAIQKLTSAGLQVQDVVVLIDRQSGASQALREQGYRLHAVYTLSGLLDYWESQQRVSPEDLAAARKFMASSTIH